VSVDVTVDRAIARPRAEVAAFAMDPANDIRWIGALTSVRRLRDDGAPVAVGSRVERVARFLGRDLRYVNEIDALEPGRRLAMHSIEAPFPMRVTYEFDDGPGGGTVARIRAEGDAGRHYRLAGPLLRGMVRGGIRRDLRRLGRVLEGR
jgi:hypothetical protein